MHILKQSELNGMPCPDTLIHGECLEAMKHIADGSVDAIIADLPYGTTQCKWDSVIPFAPLWEAYRRVIKPNGAIVLTASQPFTSALVMSNPEMFRHEWIWQKNKGSNFANTCREPMKEHESVLVFSFGKWTYNAQMQERTGGGASRVKYPLVFDSASDNYRKFTPREAKMMSENRFPSSWQKFNCETGLHPTQKPSKLFEYLVKTYTNPGELVLDNTMGSATTPVACLNTDRRFIGIELDPDYFAAGCDRVRAREIELASTLQF